MGRVTGQHQVEGLFVVVSHGGERAQQTVEKVKADLEALNAELEKEIEQLDTGFDAQAEPLDEIVVRVALVQEHWQARLFRDLELATKGIELGLARREIAKVIQTTFADGHDAAFGGEPAYQCIALGGVVGGMMRVNARG